MYSTLGMSTLSLNGNEFQYSKDKLGRWINAFKECQTNPEEVLVALSVASEPSFLPSEDAKFSSVPLSSLISMSEVLDDAVQFVASSFTVAPSHLLKICR